MRQTSYAKLSITMAAMYQGLLIILIFLRPDIHPYSNTISEWAIGRFGWLMQVAFLCSAFSYLFLYLAIRREVGGLWGKIGLAMLFICFLGTIGVGLFVTDPYPPDFNNTTTLIHTVSGGLAMVLLPPTALVINLHLSRNNQNWAPVKSIVKWTAFLPLTAFIGFFTHFALFVAPLGEGAVGEHVSIGYPPRLMFLAYHVWLAILAFQFIKLKIRQSQS